MKENIRRGLLVGYGTLYGSVFLVSAYMSLVFIFVSIYMQLWYLVLFSSLHGACL